MRGEKRAGRSSSMRRRKGGERLRCEGREKGRKRREGRKGQEVVCGEKRVGSGVWGEKGGKEQWREERKGREVAWGEKRAQAAAA